MDNSTPKLLPTFCWLLLARFFERFGYFAMLGILVLYITDPDPLKGLGRDFDDTRQLYAAFLLGLTVLKLVGGLLCDFALGTRKVLLAGSLLLLVGYLLLAFGGEKGLYAALISLAVGCGCFLAGHLGILGQLFSEHKHKLDGAMSLDYGVMNLGAAVGGYLVSSLIVDYNWAAGFMLAALSLLFSIGCLVKVYRQLPESSYRRSLATECVGGTNTNLMWIVGILGLSFAMPYLFEVDLRKFATDMQLMMMQGLISSLAPTLGVFIFGVWCWLKPSSSALKLALVMGLYILVFVIANFLPESVSQSFRASAYGIILTAVVVDVLLHPILISILLQRANPRFIASTAVCISVIPALLSWLVLQLMVS